MRVYMCPADAACSHFYSRLRGILVQKKSKQCPDWFIFQFDANFVFTACFRCLRLLLRLPWDIMGFSCIFAILAALAFAKDDRDLDVILPLFWYKYYSFQMRHWGPESEERQPQKSLKYLQVHATNFLVSLNLSSMFFTFLISKNVMSI